MSFFRQCSINDERTDGEKRRGGDHNKVIHDFLELMMEILGPLNVQADCSAISTDEMKFSARRTMEDTADCLLSYFRGSNGVLTIRTIYSIGISQLLC
jgi:hypothetical protein